MLNDGKSLNPNGVGLGLFICKNVLEQVGGSLKIVESRQVSQDVT